ncbi:MAG: trypsin-like peptidase domain-containing protein [Desulforhopalus sp.]
MKLCQTCGQHLAEEIISCPACGSRVAAGRDYIDDFRILKVLQEGHASILCKAVRKGSDQPVMIRLFTRQSGVDEKVARRLQRELDEIRGLPREMFISHHQIKRSVDGLWYRVSEWVDCENWGDLMASGRLNDHLTTLNLFRTITRALDILHQGGQFIPHLIPDDIMVIEDNRGNLTAKIDYKLSRFIDPKLDQPGPQLKRLLECHPDIVDQRPLDHRSDIWSLGRIFVQLLDSDFGLRDLLARLEDLPLPDKIKTLLKTMLAEDPNLRPQSMAEVDRILGQVTGREIMMARRIHQAKTWIFFPEMLRVKFRLRLIAVAVILLLLIGGATAWYIIFFRRDAQAVLGEFANDYAGSMAFVLVEYELQHGENTIFRNRTEGTAFLVSEDGYLLTNRHVACPWLEDNKFQTSLMYARINDIDLSFNYRMYLWFEGQRAFSRLPELDDQPDVSDVYFLQSAYRSHGTPTVKISGVAHPPVKTRLILRSPLGNDFAVLKIDKVPANLLPLPLDLDLETAKVPRLSPVITMGFPLGSRTQTSHINVSVTHGHVRRSFEDFLQVDSSIYSGNSGGPVINTSGKVIGIASAVAMQRAQGHMPVFTALSDIGLVLPINNAVSFLDDLRRGRVKWNGVLDLSLPEKIREILDLAREDKWLEAKAVADSELNRNLHPSLVMTAGILDLCVQQFGDARLRFNEALSIDNENNLARLMLYLLEWQADQEKIGGYQNSLALLDWRSEDEFMGYLVAVLENQIAEEDALSGWETLSERNWLGYIVALQRAQKGNLTGAETLLRQTILDGHPDEWSYFLAKAEVERVQQKLIASNKDSASLTRYIDTVKDFAAKEQAARAIKEIAQNEVKQLYINLSRRDIPVAAKQEIIEKLLPLTPENRRLLVRQAFLSAMSGDWENALNQNNKFLLLPGRESATRMKSSLLQAELLQLNGDIEAAHNALDHFYKNTASPWYRTIAKHLLDKKNLKLLSEQAGEHPEYLITAYTALGLWSEGEGDSGGAVEHYKLALGSYIDYWLEYDLAIERIKQLRKEEQTESSR